MNNGLIARSFTKCLLILTIFSLALHPVSAAAESKKKKKTSHKTALSVTPINKKNPKYAAIVIDADSGTILSQENADALRHPASLTKMMTLLMVFDAMDAGKIRPGQRIRVSQRAASMPATKLGLKAGSTIRIEDAIASQATLSANDMSVAIAEAISGSESAFARAMTAKAQSIGMSRTRYYNASGLPNDYQVTTARDQARLARYLLANHPTQSKVFSKQKFYYNGRTYNNHNRLMETYAGMDCCKTGFINASGFNLVASARRDGQRVIGVVLGGRTTATRNMKMASLLDDGFKQVKTVQIAKRNAPAKTPLKQPENTPAQTAPVIAATESAIEQAGGESTEETYESVTSVREAYAEAQNTARETAAMRIQKMPERPARPAIATPPQTLGTLQLNSNGTTGIPQPVPATNNLQTASLQQSPSLPANGWSIQIGAYQTRLATDQALYKAQQKLPPHLRKHQSLVVPLRTADASWMFRARLSGFTQAEASAACKYFKDCIAISPQAY